MSRIAKTAAVAAAAGAFLFTGAGLAAADNGGHDHNGHYGNGHNGHNGHDRGHHDRGYYDGGYGAGAYGVAVGSPGVLSGNVVQVPVHVPVNACGNSVNVIGALNPAGGNVCVNG